MPGYRPRENKNMAFNLNQFIQDAANAAKDTRAVKSVNDLMKYTFSDPEDLQTSITPYDGQEKILYSDTSVSVYWVRFIANELVPPHNHKMPAFIGVYQGAEVNHLYRRTADGLLELVTSKRIGLGETLSMGAEGIHGVNAEGEEDSLGLHIYLGQLPETERDIFNPDTGEAMPFTDQNYEKFLRTLN